MNTPHDPSATNRIRTGWLMIRTYVNNPYPATALSDIDPELQQASRDAVLWLGVGLVLGKTDEDAREHAYAAALRSARQLTPARGRG